jgi:hypothetical protein
MTYPRDEGLLYWQKGTSHLKAMVVYRCMAVLAERHWLNNRLNGRYRADAGVRSELSDKKCTAGKTVLSGTPPVSCPPSQSEGI